MRVDWHTVGRMIERVVAEHAASREGDGLDGLTRIGIDEVAYRKGHRYLMCVSDHGSGALVWAAPGRSQATAEAFYRALGPERLPVICGRCRSIFTAAGSAPPAPTLRTPSSAPIRST